MKTTACLISLSLLLSQAWGVAIGANSPAANSKPFEKDGLQVTVTLAKAIFACGAPLKFTVQFKNVSDKPFNLLNADGYHYRDWQILFKREGQGDWRTFGFDQAGKLKSTVLLMEPGRVPTVPVELDGIDLTGVARILSDNYQQQLAWSDGKQHPLKPGKYLLAVKMNLRDNPNDPKPAVKYWSGGQITTEPVEFEITDQPAVSKERKKELHSSVVAYPNAVLSATVAATGITVTVEPNGQELKAVNKDGAVLWQVDLLQKWGKPHTGAAVIRHLAIREGHVNVTIGKAMVGTVDLKTGEAKIIGEE